MAQWALLLLACTISSSIALDSLLVTVSSLLLANFALTFVSAGPVLSAADLTKLASEAENKKDLAGAIDYYSKLLAIDKEKTQLNYNKRAQVYIRRKQLGAAIADLTQAITLDPQFTKGFESRAKLQLMRGNCAEAAADYRTLQQLKAKKGPVFVDELQKAQRCAEVLEQAKMYFDRGQWDHAKQLYGQALDLTFDSSVLLLQRSKCYMNLRDYQSVLVDTRKILASDKSDLEALSIRGTAYYQLDEFETALTHWREGLRLAPEHVEMKDRYTKLRLLMKKEQAGDESMGKRRFKEAATSYADALTVDPSHRVHQVKLLIKHCNSLRENNEAARAVDVCSQAIALDEGNIEAWLKRADSRIAAGQWEDATRDFNRVLQMDPQNRQAHEGLQRAQLEEKKAKRKDYYKMLGVERNANSASIKKTFRKLALELHPDKIKDEEEKKVAEVKFRELVEAYEVLSDDEKRGRYDRGEDVTVQQHPGHGHGFGGFEHMFHQEGGPFGGGGGQQFHFRWG